MKRRDAFLLPLLATHQNQTRIGRDRLEILTALTSAPSFDPLFRDDIVQIPPGHQTYRWFCRVTDCQRATGLGDFCHAHREEWLAASKGGVSRSAFLSAAEPLGQTTEHDGNLACLICPGRPARAGQYRLCSYHLQKWRRTRAGQDTTPDFDGWAAEQSPAPGFGTCTVLVCPLLAESPLGLCQRHAHAYRRAGSPGGASIPRGSWREGRVAVSYVDRLQFRAWCDREIAVSMPAQLNLRGLRPLPRAEIQWGLFTHTQRSRPARWDVTALRMVVNACREQDATSIVDLDLACLTKTASGIAKEILHELRLVYFTPEEAREAGFLETRHFGISYEQRLGHISLTAISQRWLRDITWDYFAGLLRSPRCPNSAHTLDQIRRAMIELSAFIEADAPGGGHDPAVLMKEHADRFVADQRHRERHALPSLAMVRVDGKPSIVTTGTRSVVFNHTRRILRQAMDDGVTDAIGLAREFVIALPNAGSTAYQKRRRPFADEVARALADEHNLAEFTRFHDPDDEGARDIWEILVVTGRRLGEVIELRWNCIGRLNGLAMLWHDQTKVGNYDAAIRIPETLYDLIADRQRKTLSRFANEHGYTPTGKEREGLALFPTNYRSTDGTIALSRPWFYSRFRPWVDAMDIGHCVPHQARHTLATSLLRQGATLTHIRRYLGHVSDRMAEHYVHLSNTDLENVLQHVWVAGPGTAAPGELLAGDSSEALTKEQALAIAVDLARRSTPAEGGFCTFQPVVDGGACPWNLDCHNCDKFVLSGADLLYWRRKREQWRLLAEGAPDDATADYLHSYFEPTARAIDGLEKALAGLGLLDDALALDLRKPQDYFHRVWSTAFRAADLAAAGSEDEQSEYSDTRTTDNDPDQDIA
ncbi:site-specific integrase [Streptomyces sp. FL07-04A]|uniref:tyrosine-type recombinase/integrase n=1 Tax=Streptomyces sp. FL07-04A TaxID=3028658 RepID=UPI0029AD287B|nr:site-specific integrase [Streptomyces sp. FL07-04A]MDX3577840.1 site-specific integrase [Streptomyces sp. FL07-04A]